VSIVGVNRGPFAWSTSQTIMRRSSTLCWDVNGYYRSLGIGYPFVHVTVKEIREAYLALDGPNDARLTQAFTTFLDPAAKAVYDAMPLGQRYPDPYVLLEEKLASLDRGDTVPVTAKVVDGHIVYDIPEGYEMISGHAPGSLDNGRPTSKDDHHVSAKDPYYPYTVLLWDVAHFDSLVLEMWQKYLLAAAQEALYRPDRIGMGVTEGKGGWVTGTSRGIPTVFVDRWSPPSMSVAREMIQLLA